MRFVYSPQTVRAFNINFRVESIDDIMRSYYFLSDKQVHIVFGPGRYATSVPAFLYFEGPDGMVYEYSNGVKIIYSQL